MLLTGHVTFTNKNLSNFYVFRGGLGGVLNEYYEPTISIVSNPYLKYFESLKIDEDCVVIRNTPTFTPSIIRWRLYADILAHTILSIRRTLINMRAPYALYADNSKTAETAKAWTEELERGNTAIIAGSTFFEGVKSVPYFQLTNTLKELIENYQYWFAQMIMEDGLPINYNMKRETLNDSEVHIGDYSLTPYASQLLKCRQDAIDKINKKYGLNIKVRYNDSWERFDDELTLTVERLKQEVNQDETETETKTN